jgi:hypothetical protein
VRVALVNPPWSFEHTSISARRAPHLPLELATAKALLTLGPRGADARDAHLCATPMDALRRGRSALARPT